MRQLNLLTANPFLHTVVKLAQIRGGRESHNQEFPWVAVVELCQDGLLTEHYRYSHEYYPEKENEACMKWIFY